MNDRNPRPKPKHENIDTPCEPFSSHRNSSQEKAKDKILCPKNRPAIKVTGTLTVSF